MACCENDKAICHDDAVAFQNRVLTRIFGLKGKEEI
jgi:hypothetical protein